MTRRTGYSNTRSLPYPRRKAADSTIAEADSTTMERPSSSASSSAEAAPVVTLPSKGIKLNVVGNFCGFRKCISSHKMANVEPYNIGQYYAGGAVDPTRYTDLFPSICQSCLLAKFGLVESYNTANKTVYNCILEKTQGTSAIRSEGPYLRAFKPSTSLVKRNAIVFEADTIIVPSGQVLLDILMSDPEKLYNDQKVPKVIAHVDGTLIGSNVNLERKYTLNPYLFGYFKHIYDAMSCNSTIDTRGTEFTKLEHFISDKVMKASDNIYLNTSYELDAFVLSDLITPTAGRSCYVRHAETLKLVDKTMFVEVVAAEPDPAAYRDQYTAANEHSLVATVQSMDFREKIEGVKPETIRDLLDNLNPHLYTTRQIMVNREPTLRNYFADRNHLPTRSSTALHVSSMCVPSLIVETEMREEAKVLKRIKPNVMWVEGIGLCSTGPICDNDYLVINETVDIDDFIRIKVNSHKRTITYRDPKDLEVNKPAGTCDGGSSHSREIRRPAIPTMSMYSAL
jgi:hypothetical protein